MGLKVPKFFPQGKSLMSLTKDDITDSVRNRLNLPKAKSAELLESLLEIMKETLENGEDVLVSGFGKFCVKEKRERRGRNPETGTNMLLGARRVVTFSCSSVIRNKINGKR
jgi:integration host factor subunit alpha